MAKLAEQQIHRLTIEGYASDGSGVARLEGMVVFVQGGIRGEVCDVRLTHVGRTALWGRVHEVITPSPARVVPDCPHYGRCGGCQFRHMDYAQELEAKHTRVYDALTRLGGVEHLELPPVLGSPKVDRYRNKAQFPVSRGPRIGFYQNRTHRVVDVPDCLLQSQAAGRLRQAVKEWMTAWSVPAYDEKSRLGLVRHLYVRTNRRGESLCCLLVNGRGIPREHELVAALRSVEPGLTGVVLGINQSHSNVILGESYCTLWGRDFLSDRLCGYSFQLSVPSFYQVNPDQAEVLYSKALEFAQLTREDTALDLYCGIGTISLVLARQAGMVWGAEVVPQAVDDAVENARRNGVANARFLCGDAGEAARRLDSQGVRPGVICVDPPRKGLAEEVVDIVASMAPRRVVYVSCDPGTLGRDVKRFAGHGYVLTQAAAVDLFPRTAHVETVCLLSKLNVKEHIEVELDMDELDLTTAESKATYEEIREYVLEHTGLKVSHLYIAQVKQKYGIIERENYNKPKSENSRQPKCPPEKEAAITDALKFFGMV